MTGMESIPDESIDLVVTDPPYNAKKDFKNDNMPEEEFLDFTRRWFSIVVKKLKPVGSFYCFINEEYVCKFRFIFDELLKFKRMICWNFEGFFNNPGNNYDNRIEYILFYTKTDVYTFNKMKEPPSDSYLERWAQYADDDGNVPWDNLSPTERKRYKRENYEKNPKNVNRGLYQGNYIKECRPRYKEHQTQKPEPLVAKFIEISSNRGDSVLDPFAGSGTTVIVAKKLGRTGIGFEIDDGFFFIGKSVLEETFDGEKIRNPLWKRTDKKGVKRLDQFM